MLPNDILEISVSSMYPQDIIIRLQNLQQRFGSRPVALMNNDVWRYGSDPVLQEFLLNDPRTFYIFTVGHDHTIRAKNIAEIPYQYFYFNRPHDIEPDIDKQRKVGFSCLNNSSSFHRLVLGCRLFRANLVDSIIFSQNVTEMPEGNYEGLLDNIPGMSAYLATLPRRWAQETSQDFRKSYHSINHCAYSDSYCNIVTETEMQEFVFEGPVIDLPIVTEKSFKPFRAKQIPCYMAAPGHMRYLESLGFETMTDLVSDDVDRLGVFDRAVAITDVVAKGHDFIQTYYHDHRQQIQHNFDLIHSDKVETLLCQNTRDFLHRFHHVAL